MRQTFRSFVRFAVICLSLASCLECMAASPKKEKSVPSMRWAEGQPGCTFSRDRDGKYRYALWTDDYGVIVAVDSQELQLLHKRIEPFFAVHLTVRYRGKATLEVYPEMATLEFVKHFKLIQSALDPETFAQQTQDDADEVEHETQREVEKHPERREEREKYVETYQKEAAEFVEFLNTRSFPAAELDTTRAEASGWIFFSVKNKWLGGWKKPEEFVLRLPLNKQILEFPFALPPQAGDLILRQR